MSDGAFWRGALLDELERAVAQRERWRAWLGTAPDEGDATILRLVVTLITALIERAKAALAGDDAAAGARLIPELHAAAGE